MQAPPMSSSSTPTATPASSNPVSPDLAHPLLHPVNTAIPPPSRQLRPPKGPLYVPAALRPTERQAWPGTGIGPPSSTSASPKPASPAPPTPPRSQHGSPGTAAVGTGTATAPGSPASRHTVVPAPLARRATADGHASELSKLAEDEWLRAQNLGDITGLPTRDHWKADAASPSCDSPACRSSFSLFRRRHHCRHCGHVFCASHSPHTVRLDQLARFHPDGVPSRACELCWQAYCRWADQRADRVSQIERDLSAQLEERRGRGEDASPAMARPLAAASAASARASPVPESNSGTLTPDHPGDMVASSVPRDWSWSTF